MCSELLHIPYVWYGVPIFGIGVLLAIWAVGTVVTLVSMVRRHGWSGETWGALPPLFIVGAAIVGLPHLFPGGLPLRGYGLMMLTGIAAGIGLAIIRARQKNINPELILSLAVWLVIFGVIGGRVFFLIEYWPTKVAGRSLPQTLLEIINIPEGGLVVYGALIGAAIGFLLFTRKHKLPTLAWADMIAPSLAIGLAFGRIGCFLNGCCYGGETDRHWAVTFPKYSTRYEAAKESDARRYSPPYADQASRGEMHGFQMATRGEPDVIVSEVDAGSPAAEAGLAVGDVIAKIDGEPVRSLSQAERIVFSDFASERALALELASGKKLRISPAPMPARSRPVHPAQLYSAFDAALLCWLLWSFYPFRRHDGQVVALMLMLHPITRFLLEIIRTDEPAVFGTGLSISQNLSVGLFVIGVALWWHASKLPSIPPAASAA